MLSVEWGEIQLNVHFTKLSYFLGFIISVDKISQVGLVHLPEHGPVPF